jgi:hypothetical protein
MTEQHRYVDADAEKLTDGEFVRHVAHPGHPHHPGHSDSGPAGESGEPDAAPAQEPQR